ncbi:MAG: CapA family protein [Eubacteriales bacterium]|nr:CapA family protein [Eubacteriales bacterium]
MKKRTAIVILFIALIGAVGGFTFLYADALREREVLRETEEMKPDEPLAPKSDTPSVPQEVPPQRVTIAGVGDNLIHDPIYMEAEQADGSYDFSHLYEHVRDMIEPKDIAIINQESIIGGDEYGPSGYPAFNTPEDMAGYLKAVGFDAVTLANNHILDKGPKAVEHTIAVWETAGLFHSGANRSEAERHEIPIMEKNGVKIALLSYTYGTNGIEPDVPWRTIYLDDKEGIRADIRKAKTESDFVIVAAHWGDENVMEPNEQQRDMAKFFSDEGVDVVLGCHPHVVQPVEWQMNAAGEKTLVIYSMGNYISAMFGLENMLGYTANFDLVKDGVTKRVENVKMIPTVTHFEGHITSYHSACSNFKIYKLADYTDEIAARHGLNVYHGTTLTNRFFQDMFEEAVPAEFR